MRALRNVRSRQPPLLAYRLVRAAGRESRAAWGSAGAWEPPAKSTTPTPAFLPLPASLGCGPARPADAQPALLCSAPASPRLRRLKKQLEAPEYFAVPPSGLPEATAALSAAQEPFVCILQSHIESSPD